MQANALVAKIWTYCDTLRDDGVGYGDYLEQITYLLFLKMADEFSRPPHRKNFDIPKKYSWPSLVNQELSTLTFHYSNCLKELSKSGGMLTKIFNGAQNKIHDPYKLKKLIELIDEETWITTSTDIKGDIYESLLQKNAESSGAGQYFTPRPLIQAIVECIGPEPMKKIADPSCGTGGFFLSALSYIKANYKLTKQQKDYLQFETFHGWEIVPSTARLCLMNLFLHGIGDLKTTPEIDVVDSLLSSPKSTVDIVLANPPFGKSSSLTITNEKKLANSPGFHLRNEFWATTSNKQLAFLQHIYTILKPGGEAAIVLPDNVLFEGGVGEIVRRALLNSTNLHTILRLPTGIFYAQGVKANVLFFTKSASNGAPATKEIWFYDYRTNVHHTLKKNPLKFSDLEDFIECYNPENIAEREPTWSPKNVNGRWRNISYDKIISRDKVNLDIFWISDESLLDIENLPTPDEIAVDIIENIKAGLSSFEEVLDILKSAPR